MSFWDVVWFIIITFAFVAYLMVLFSILGDLFRDRSTSGGMKALWVIGLVFLPLITSLIYLIARGTGMTDRSMEMAERQRVQQEAYIRDVAAQKPSSAADQIAQAKALLDAGVISQAEYDTLKHKALV